MTTRRLGAVTTLVRALTLGKTHALRSCSTYKSVCRQGIGMHGKLWGVITGMVACGLGVPTAYAAYTEVDAFFVATQWEFSYPSGASEIVSLSGSARQHVFFVGNRFLLSPFSEPNFVCLLHRTHIAVAFRSWLDDVGRREEETEKLNPMRMD